MYSYGLSSFARVSYGDASSGNPGSLVVLTAYIGAGFGSNILGSAV